MSDIYQGIRSILEDDPRYSRAAYFFLFEALEHTLKLREQDGHVSVENLLEGIRLLAIARFGLLAKTVFNDWGVHATEDLPRCYPSYRAFRLGSLGRWVTYRSSSSAA